MRSNSSSSDNQIRHSNKTKASRWIKGVINWFVRSKLEGAYERFEKLDKQESNNETSTDFSSTENITFDSTADAAAQYSSINIFSVESKAIEIDCSHRPKTKDAWNQPSTLPRLRSKPSAHLRPRMYHNLSMSSKKYSVSEYSMQRNPCSRSRSLNYDFNPNCSCQKPKFCKEPEAKMQTSSNCGFYSSFHQNSEINSRTNHINNGSLLGSGEEPELWSLHYGEVSPKKLEDSLEYTKEEIYSPIKYVRMENQDDDKLKQKEEIYSPLKYIRMENYDEDKSERKEVYSPIKYIRMENQSDNRNCGQKTDTN